MSWKYTLIVMSERKDKNDVPFTERKHVTHMMAVLSGLHAELYCYPFDISKTRLQVQGEIANVRDAKLVRAPHRRLIPTLIGIIKEEGYRNLYFGYSAVATIQLIYQGLRVTIYKTLREDLFGYKRGQSIPLQYAIACSVAAGATGNFLVTPVHIARYRLQMEGKRKILELEPRVKNLRDAFKDAWSQGGLRGFYKGWGCAVCRGACVTTGDIAGYDVVKRNIIYYTDIKEGRLLHILSSLCAGLSASVLGAPVDFVQARYMHQRVDTHGKALVYKYGYHVVIEAVRNEGILCLYKGFVPLYFRCGPWAIIFWMTFEEIKYLLGGEHF